MQAARRYFGRRRSGTICGTSEVSRQTPARRPEQASSERRLRRPLVVRSRRAADRQSGGRTRGEAGALRPAFRAFGVCVRRRPGCSSRRRSRSHPNSPPDTQRRQRPRVDPILQHTASAHRDLPAAGFRFAAWRAWVTRPTTRAPRTAPTGLLPSETATDLTHARFVGRTNQTGPSRQADAEWPA
jgi:hypothetical protein